MKNKNAQHEMVGFVLIIVIVVVVGLFFLMFYLRKPVETESKSVESFLQSAMIYTTNCSIREPEYQNIKELIISCRKNKRCVNSYEMACDILNITLREILESVWEIEADAYEFSIQYEDSSINSRENIIGIEYGNFEECKSKTGAEHLFPFIEGFASGDVIITMRICSG